MMDPVYILILAIAGMLTAALTVLKIYSMRKEATPIGQNNLKSKMKDLETQLEKKQDIRLCDDRHTNVQRELSKGDKQFKAILEVQSNQAQLLARIDERVEFLADQNGFKRK